MLAVSRVEAPGFSPVNGIRLKIRGFSGVPGKPDFRLAGVPFSPGASTFAKPLPEL